MAGKKKQPDEPAEAVQHEAVVVTGSYSTQYRGQKHSARNLEIAQRVQKGETVADLATEYGLTATYLNHILRMLTWPTAGITEPVIS